MKMTLRHMAAPAGQGRQHLPSGMGMCLREIFYII